MLDKRTIVTALNRYVVRSKKKNTLRYVSAPPSYAVYDRGVIPHALVAEGMTHAEAQNMAHSLAADDILKAVG